MSPPEPIFTHGTINLEHKLEFETEARTTKQQELDKKAQEIFRKLQEGEEFSSEDSEEVRKKNQEIEQQRKKRIDGIIHEITNFPTNISVGNLHYFFTRLNGLVVKNSNQSNTLADNYRQLLFELNKEEIKKQIKDKYPADDFLVLDEIFIKIAKWKDPMHNLSNSVNNEVGKHTSKISVTDTSKRRWDVLDPATIALHDNSYYKIPTEKGYNRGYSKKTEAKNAAERDRLNKKYNKFKLDNEDIFEKAYIRTGYNTKDLPVEDLSEHTLEDIILACVRIEKEEKLINENKFNREVEKKEVRSLKPGIADTDLEKEVTEIIQAKVEREASKITRVDALDIQTYNRISTPEQGKKTILTFADRKGTIEVGVGKHGVGGKSLMWERHYDPKTKKIGHLSLEIGWEGDEIKYDIKLVFSGGKPESRLLTRNEIQNLKDYQKSNIDKTMRNIVIDDIANVKKLDGAYLANELSDQVLYNRHSNDNKKMQADIINAQLQNKYPIKPEKSYKVNSFAKQEWDKNEGVKAVGLAANGLIVDVVSRAPVAVVGAAAGAITEPIATAVGGVFSACKLFPEYISRGIEEEDSNGLFGLGKAIPAFLLRLGATCAETVAAVPMGMFHGAKAGSNWSPGEFANKTLVDPSGTSGGLTMDNLHNKAFSMDNPKTWFTPSSGDYCYRELAEQSGTDVPYRRASEFSKEFAKQLEATSSLSDNHMDDNIKKMLYAALLDLHKNARLNPGNEEYAQAALIAASILPSDNMLKDLAQKGADAKEKFDENILKINKEEHDKINEIKNKMLKCARAKINNHDAETGAELNNIGNEIVEILGTQTVKKTGEEHTSSTTESSSKPNETTANFIGAIKKIPSKSPEDPHAEQVQSEQKIENTR